MVLHKFFKKTLRFIYLSLSVCVAVREPLSRFSPSTTWPWLGGSPFTHGTISKAHIFKSSSYKNFYCRVCVCICTRSKACVEVSDRNITDFVFQTSFFKHSGFPAVCTQVEVRGPVACRVASLVAAAFTHGAISAALTCL